MTVRWASGVLALVGVLLGVVALWPSGELTGAAAGEYRVYVPLAVKGGAPAPPTPVPTTAPQPTAVPYGGNVASLYLAGAQMYGTDPVEVRGTTVIGGTETFEDPSNPLHIAWYPEWGSGQSQPGWGGSNSVFAAHVNYVGYGRTPFANLTSASAGDVLVVTMANGHEYAYSVQSVQVIGLEALEYERGGVSFDPGEYGADHADQLRRDVCAEPGRGRRALQQQGDPGGGAVCGLSTEV